MYKYTVINRKTLRGISNHHTKKAALKAKALYCNKYPSKRDDIGIMTRID